MARFVFVHGSWQGAWCWRGILPLLVTQGHEAIAIDLPGHGEDRSPVEAVTFQDYVDRTLDAVRASPEPPILVGHSMGGAIISQAAECLPDRIRGLVCVAALTPPNGVSMMKLVEEFDPEYLAQIQWALDRRTVRISPEGAREFLYPHCPPGTVESALPLFTAEPLAPYETPLSLTEANFGRVPRYYVECLRDRVVPIALQRTMRSAFPFVQVYSLDTDHSPFFSTPKALAVMFHAIAAQS